MRIVHLHVVAVALTFSQALESKADEDPSCSCVQASTISTLSNKVNDLSTSQSVDEWALNGLRAYLVNMTDCNQRGLFYDAAKGVCRQGVLVTCSETVPNLNANAVADCSSSNFYGAPACQASCKPGYTGSGEFTCDILGNWQGSVTCQALCDPYVLPNTTRMARGDCSTDIVQQGTTCTPKCQTGWDQIGAVAVTCQADRTWSSPVGFCASTKSVVDLR